MTHADRFAALRPYRIEIRLHGITRGTFERVTLGEGSYDRCLQAIGFLLDRQIPLVLKSTAMTLNLGEVLAIKRYVESLGTVRYKLGEEMRPELDGGAGPFQYALSEQDLAELNQQDTDLQRDACRRDSLEPLRPESICDHSLWQNEPLHRLPDPRLRPPHRHGKRGMGSPQTDRRSGASEPPVQMSDL